MNITTVGIDLAMNVFQVHGVDAGGKVVLRKQLRRAQVAVFFGNLPSYLIGMEAGTNVLAGSFEPGNGEPQTRQNEHCQSASGFLHDAI
jgi:hypothetical protein